MKNYILIYEDRQGNELQTKVIEAVNIKEARQTASKILAISNMNDLKRIVVKSN